jgi:nicotinate-nucleotide adenylyltransferase
LVAVLRPGYAVPWTRLEAVLPDARERVVSVTMPEVGISSTEVRRRIAAGESVRYWVPDTVREYIQAHHLYGA